MSRSQLLRRIVEGEFPTVETLEALKSLPTENGVTVTLQRRHVCRLLVRYIEGQVSGDEVAGWAKVLDDAADVVREDGVVGHTLFFLANPLLEGELTQTSAREFLDALCDEDDD